ncbi:hypothetical protein ABTY98_41555 [Streptomyces sp. NPDC096040]|uniref:hypothetical protein n=1 Tax=Streptomyces sp. NPDC096040 TaxID=3155541 RepID=UPI0033183498
MCNPPAPTPEHGPELWGHSTAAHRVHGWCADCKGHDLPGEAVAWRVHENRRHDAEQAALAASEANRRTVDLQATHDHLCPVCGQEALTVVTVTLVLDNGRRHQAGGWAHCTVCDATPHPTMEDSARG